MAEAEDGDVPWVALGTYAERTGQHIDAVRAAVRRGRLKARKGNDGRWLVPMLPRAASGVDAGKDSGMPKADSGTALALSEAVTELRVALAEARTEAAAARVEASRLRDELAESRTAFARSEAERRAAQAVAIAEVNAAKQAAEAEIAAKDALVNELKALLAEARRPWWRKLLG